jgi:hypothetical protein
VYSELGKKPQCMAPVGCPIIDVAPDRKLNRKVDAFLLAETLEQSPAYSRMQAQLLEGSGLMEEHAETILEMKIMYAHYKQWKGSVG